MTTAIKTIRRCVNSLKRNIDQYSKGISNAVILKVYTNPE